MYIHAYTFLCNIHICVFVSNIFVYIGTQEACTELLKRANFCMCTICRKTISEFRDSSFEYAVVC